MSEDLVGRVLHDSHRIVRLIGRGGMGAVYEAVHVRLLKRRFAVKVLHSRMVENKTMYSRFRQEAEIASELGHPNIVSVNDFYTTEDGLPCMVMEYLEGEDLGSRLDREGRLSPALTMQMVEQVGSALQAVHDKGITHRDVKPANIFLLADDSERLRVKVLDFGISKMHDSNMELTGAETVLGTPHYMAPEQAEGGGDNIGPATDLFALATITFQALTGKLPFDGPSMPIVIYNISNQELPPISELVQGLSPGVEAALRSATEKNPEDRYPHVLDFIGDLKRGIEGSQAVYVPLVLAEEAPAPAPDPSGEPSEEMGQTVQWSSSEDLFEDEKKGPPGAGVERGEEPERKTMALEPGQDPMDLIRDGAGGPDEEQGDEEFSDDIMQTMLDTDVQAFAVEHYTLESAVDKLEQDTRLADKETVILPGSEPPEGKHQTAVLERSSTLQKKQTLVVEQGEPQKKSRLPVVVAVAVALAVVVAGVIIMVATKNPHPAPRKDGEQPARGETPPAKRPPPKPGTGPGAPPAEPPAKEGTKPAVNEASTGEGEAKQEPGPASEPGATTPALEQVKIELVLSPPSARVLLDGEARTDNPLVIPRGKRDHRLRVTAPGHTPYQQQLSAEANRTIRVTLSKTRAVAPAKKRPAGKRKSRRRKGRRKKKDKAPFSDF